MPCLATALELMIVLYGWKCSRWCSSAKPLREHISDVTVNTEYGFGSEALPTTLRLKRTSVYQAKCSHNLRQEYVVYNGSTSITSTYLLTSEPRVPGQYRIQILHLSLPSITLWGADSLLHEGAL